MENRVELLFDSTITRLAGYPFGKEVYDKQVRGKLDYSKVAYIEFPTQIVKAASSFTQGFFEEIINEVGFDGLDEKIILVCSTTLKESIISNL